jgi:hypothetical protein
MLIVDDCIISDNLADVRFCCDIKQCKGVCCVEGDCGAPLDKEEIPVLERIYLSVKPYMTAEGIAVVERNGVSSIDVDGLPCTPLVNNRECAYAIVEDGVTLCAIEKAWRDGKVDFPKPISCHLYPVRIEDFGEFKAINYHEWDVCRCAVAKGRAEGKPLYQYLREPLVRRFGQRWYDELAEQCEAMQK